MPCSRKDRNGEKRADGKHCNQLPLCFNMEAFVEGGKWREGGGGVILDHITLRISQ